MYSRIIAIKNYWTKKTCPEFIRGTFNEEHYKKVINAKINSHEIRIK